MVSQYSSDGVNFQESPSLIKLIKLVGLVKVKQSLRFQMANFNFTFQPGISSEQNHRLRNGWAHLESISSGRFPLSIISCGSKRMNCHLLSFGGAIPYLCNDGYRNRTRMRWHKMQPLLMMMLRSPISTPRLAPDGLTQYRALLNDIPYQFSDSFHHPGQCKSLGL